MSYLLCTHSHSHNHTHHTPVHTPSHTYTLLTLPIITHHTHPTHSSYTVHTSHNHNHTHTPHKNPQPHLPPHTPSPYQHTSHTHTTPTHLTLDHNHTNTPHTPITPPTHSTPVPCHSHRLSVAVSGLAVLPSLSTSAPACPSSTAACYTAPPDG